MKATRLGEAQTYEQLASILAARRRAMGLTQMELGFIADLQDGYVAKLEIGRQRGGRSAGRSTLYPWLKALGVKLVVIEE